MQPGTLKLNQRARDSDLSRLRRLAFCKMIMRRQSSTMPHSLISSIDLKQPRQVRSSSRQQFRMQGDCTERAISLICNRSKL